MNFNPEFHWQKEKKQELKKRATKILIIVFVALFACVFVIKKCHFISYISMSYDSSIPENTKSITRIIDADKIFYKNTYDIKYIDDLKNNIANSFHCDKSKIDLMLSYVGKNIYFIENSDSQAIIANVSNFYIFQNTISSFAKFSSEEEFNNHKIYSYNADIGENPIFNTKTGNVFITSLNDYSIVVSNDIDEIKQIIDKNQKDGKDNYIKSIKSSLSGYIDDNSGVSIKISDYNDIDNSKTFIKGLSNIYKTSKNNKLYLSSRISNSGIDINIQNQVFKNQNFDNFLMNQSQFSLIYQNIDKKISGNINFGENISKYLDSILQTPYGLDIKNELQKINPPFSFFVYKNSNFLLFGKDNLEIEYIYKNILAHLQPSKRSMKLPDNTYATELYINPKSINLVEKDESGIKYEYLQSTVSSSVFLAKCNDNSIISNNKNIITSFCNSEVSYDYTQNNNIKELFVLDKNISKNSPGFLNGFKIKYNKFKAINLSQNDDINIYFKISN